MKISFPSQKTAIFIFFGLFFLGALFLIFKPHPKTLVLKVPFTTQAPLGNWEGNENCEETSAIMAAAYFQGNTVEEMPPEIAAKEIAKLIAWENDTFHYNANTGAQDTSQMVNEALHLKTKVVENFSEDDLKNALASHQLILLPLNAQLLAPNNYPDLHPTYHMIIIHGYDKRGFIVHDPGTNSGKNNVYSFENLQKAAVDWNLETKTIEPNKKLAVIVHE